METAIVQPLGLIVNPFTVLSLAFFAVGLLFMLSLKKSLKYSVLVGLMFGLLCQIKIYVGLIAIAAVSFYGLYLFLRYRKKYLLNSVLAIGFTAILTAITFLPNNLGQGGLIFDPLNFYNHYISQDSFNSLNWGVRLSIFDMDNNYLRIILLYVEAISIFFFLNLGLRSILILKSKQLLKKSFWLNDFNFILAVSVITPILIGSLFIQSVSVFDTVQFFWVVLVLLCLPAAIVLGDFLKNKAFKFKALAFILIIIFSVPGNITFLNNYNPGGANAMISKKDVDFYNKVDSVVKEKDFVIFFPKKDRETGLFLKTDTPVVSAMLGRSVFFEYGGLPAKNTLNVIGEREKELLKLKAEIKSCNKDSISKELGKIGTNYIIGSWRYKCLVPQLKFSSGDLYFYVVN